MESLSPHVKVQQHTSVGKKVYAEQVKSSLRQDTNPKNGSLVSPSESQKKAPADAAIPKNIKNTNDVNNTNNTQVKPEGSKASFDPNLYSRRQLRLSTGDNKLQIHVINPETGEVIEEIPSNRLLDFYKALGEFSGFLIEKRG